MSKLCEGKTPRQIEKLRILDPACGSGSFLIGAYTSLLDYHRNWYVEDGPQKHIKEIYQGTGGQWFLTTQEKKGILLNNIYGVDIDSQAVEVTKLSLLLKVLEGENQDSLTRQLKLLRERALPDLGNNIKCGNSLIGTDFYENKQISLLDDEERYRINAFDWSVEFSEIMNGRGFDAVIGNPPYVFGETYGISVIEKNYFKTLYKSGTGKVNLFALFIERSIQILRTGGLLSFIIPNTFLRVTSYADAREFVVRESAIRKIVDMGTGVFANATTSSIILVLEKQRDPMLNQVAIHIGIDSSAHEISQKEFARGSFIFNIRTTPSQIRLNEKIKKRSLELGTLCNELIFGVVITKNRHEVVTTTMRPGYKPFLEGKDISRYLIRPTEKYLRYEPRLLHRPRTPEVFEVAEKLLIQRITGGNRPLNVAYDDRQHYDKESINNLILKKSVGYGIKYILGLLNSRLINWFYKVQFTNDSTLTVNISKEYLSQIPIRAIESTNSNDRALHDQVVAVVDRMLDLSKRNADSKTPNDKTRLVREIESKDRQIDQLVYQLYSLTDEEIKIVEESTE